MSRIQAGRVLALKIPLILLAACGGGSDDKAAIPNPPAASATYSGNPQPTQGRSAEDVAKSTRGKLRCPADVTLPPRPDNQPVDDLMGVRPGMPYEEAAKVVLCTDELLVMSEGERRGFSIKTYGMKVRQGFDITPAKPDVPMTQDAMMARMREEARQRNNFVRVRDVPPGHSKWAVGTMGLPGEETVINVIREQWFDAERLPPAASVEQALIQKYGEPTKRNEYGSKALLWAFDTRGRPITETSRLYRECRLDHRIGGRLELKPDCGLTIAAKLNPPQGNEQLVQFLELHITDQAAGFTAIQETEAGLLAIDEGRKARELDQAGRNADEVKL